MDKDEKDMIMEIEFKSFESLRNSLNDLYTKMSLPNKNGIPHLNHDELHSYIQNVRIQIERSYNVLEKIRGIEKLIREIFQIGKNIDNSD